jgi:hypothetical protein
MMMNDEGCFVVSLDGEMARCEIFFEDTYSTPLGGGMHFNRDSIDSIHVDRLTDSTHSTHSLTIFWSKSQPSTRPQTPDRQQRGTSAQK